MVWRPYDAAPHLSVLAIATEGAWKGLSSAIEERSSDPSLWSGPGAKGEPGFGRRGEGASRTGRGMLGFAVLLVAACSADDPRAMPPTRDAVGTASLWAE